MHVDLMNSLEFQGREAVVQSMESSNLEEEMKSNTNNSNKQNESTQSLSIEQQLFKLLRWTHEAGPQWRVEKTAAQGCQG